MTMVKVTLTMHLETSEGAELSEAQRQATIHDTDAAIRNRLMGEGFLADDIYLETYTIRAN